jgi:hypothetical protein
MTLSSPGLNKNDKKQFVMENDTMRLTYDFNGKGGPMSVNIYNKSTQPLYVNWKKSALIRDEHSISLFDRNVNFTASSSSATYRFGRYASATTGNMAGSFTMPEGVDFIPPGSSISKGLLVVTRPGDIAMVVPDSVTKKSLAGSTGYGAFKYQELGFDENISPLRFKCYLTFVLGNNESQEFAESNSFYAAKLFQSNTSPEQFYLYQQQGDQLFVKFKAGSNQ